MKGPTVDAVAVRRTQTWMEYLAKIIVMGTIFFSVVGIIGYSVDLYRHGKQKHYIGWFSGAGFVLLTIPISVRLIVQHLTHWNAPHIQKYVVRIIWMIPIYSIESWFALRFKEASIYIETVRECYEAYVIFCFMYFLIALLGDEQSLVLKLKQKPAEFGRHSWPISLVVKPWSMGNEMLQKCKFGVFQYVIIKNIIAIVVCVLASRGQYAEGKFRLDGFFLYQCFICNASQIWALYCLVLFYFATKDELAPYRPVGKFLSVKTVVFFTWWQSLVINILASPLRQSAEADLGDQQWTNNEISKGLQDYLICIEMFFASIAFSYAFTHRDYQSAAKTKSEEEEVKPFLSAFLQSSVPDDIIADLRRFARGNSLVKRVLGNSLDAAENYDSGSDEESSTHSIHSTTGLTSSASVHGGAALSLSGGGSGSGSGHGIIGTSTHGANAGTGTSGTLGLITSSLHSSGHSSGQGSVSGTPRTTSSALSPNNINNLAGPNTIHVNALSSQNLATNSASNSAHSVDHLLEANATAGSSHAALPSQSPSTAHKSTGNTHINTTTSSHASMHTNTHNTHVTHATHTNLHAHTKHPGSGIALLSKKARSTSTVLGEEEFEKTEKAD